MYKFELRILFNTLQEISCNSISTVYPGIFNTFPHMHNNLEVITLNCYLPLNWVNFASFTIHSIIQGPVSLSILLYQKLLYDTRYYEGMIWNYIEMLCRLKLIAKTRKYFVHTSAHNLSISVQMWLIESYLHLCLIQRISTYYFN